MSDRQAPAPESSAMRVALWRALHAQIDPLPHVIEDEIGLRLLAPAEDWRRRPDMDPEFTKPFRASIVARARLIEDIVREQGDRGIGQYVILGAGLDTFAQRMPQAGSKLKVFEVDQAGPQAWKQQRLIELGFGVPDWLRFVPVNFEAGEPWWERLASSGFDPAQPAVVASTGVSMYLSMEAIASMMRRVATFAPGSTFAMTFLLPLERTDETVRSGVEQAEKGARASGTPFVSFFTPAQMLAMAREAGFGEVRHVSAAALAERYFADRTDGLRPPNGGEEVLVAVV